MSFFFLAHPVPPTSYLKQKLWLKLKIIEISIKHGDNVHHT